MPIIVREASGRRDIRRFVDFPWSIYRGDPNWVPPLKSEIWATVTGKDNPLTKLGPFTLFLAEDNGVLKGRVMACIDETLNAARGNGWGYFTLFEAADIEAAAALLEACENWLRARGCRVCRGPVSPDNGDDYRGMLVEGFDSPPVFMDSYNPPHYMDYMGICGYKGDGDDRLAYYYEVPTKISDKLVSVVKYAQERWGYRVDKANLNNLEAEFADLKTIVDAAMPEWPDMVPPTMDELRLMAKKIVPVADPDFILVARSNANEPIGFLLGLPDYNQVLKHLNGSLFPFGWAKFLWHRRKIDAIRVFVLFVVPAWQKKAVSHAMFLDLIGSCHRKGIKWGEGSTILESNGPMNRDAVGAGGVLYKRYRTFEKAL